MTFRQLEAFLEVVRRGGFTRAAEALCLTQPTVSGQIKELEELLGVPLFHRLPRAVELTEAGQQFLPRARSMVGAREDALQWASTYRGLLTGVLEIAASTIPGEYILPPLLAAFKARYPLLRLILRVYDSAEVLAAVAEGRAALGVVGSAPSGGDLRSVPLWSDCVGLYAGSAFRGQLPHRLDQLWQVPLVLRERGSGTRAAVERLLGDAGLAVDALNVVAEFGSTTAVKQAVAAGVGLGFISDRALTCEIGAGLLQLVAVEGFRYPKRRFYVVHDPQRYLSPAASGFLDVLCSGSETADAGAHPG